MAVYKFTAVSVGYWRGIAKRWQNSFHYDISSDAIAVNCLADFKSKILALGSSQVAGGLSSIMAYNTETGGVPIGSNIFFDWTTPSSWVVFPTTGPWGVSGVGGPVASEAAARFRTQAGYGSTGKPVYVGIYWHSFEAGADGAAHQFSATAVTAASAAYNALQVLDDGTGPAAVQVTPGGGSIAGSGVLLPYVDSHQRTRGRRRKKVVIDGVSYFTDVAKAAKAIGSVL